MKLNHEIGVDQLTLSQLAVLLDNKINLSLSAEAKLKVAACREYLDNKMQQGGNPIYGINTGFGSLYNQKISANDTGTLQENLLISHACGMGDKVPAEVVRLMLFLKIQGLSYGHSGVQVETVEFLMTLFNQDVFPVIFQQGSLGASGDLAPLAHLTLPMIGLGEVEQNGQQYNTSALLETLGLKPIKFKSKEALALLNGTQFMSAYGAWCTIHAQRIAKWADVIGAISLEAFDGRIEAFSPLIHGVRPHAGQSIVAQNIRTITNGSELILAPKQHVQDPYSFRCIPQVHGASRDAINYVQQVIETEINSVTDNPTLFPTEDQIISGGNFHGQPLALALDFMAMGLAELGNISERRTYQLISGNRNLPPFLIQNAGLNSGFMIPQYTAASIVSQNKQLCTPASVDSIVSSNGQEDHVSMGANSAVKCYKVVENCYRILAIELITAIQAMEFRRPLKSSPIIEGIITAFRQEVSFIANDKLMYPELNKAVTFIKEKIDLLHPMD